MTPDELDRCEHEWDQMQSLDMSPPIVSSHCANCGIWVTSQDWSESGPGATP